MIKFLGASGGDKPKPLVGIGLSAADCLALVHGRVLLIDVDVMAFEVGDRGGVLVFAAETDAQLIDAMVKHGVVKPETAIVRMKTNPITGE